MAFASKGRQRYHNLVQRERTVAVLNAASTAGEKVDARRKKRQMQTQYHAESLPSLGAAWNPKGKRKAGGKDTKGKKANQTLRLLGTI